MSAREELLGMKPDEGFTEARWARRVDTILGQHAHELAEKQRRYRDDVDPWVSRDHLINLIDPEVSDG